MPPIGKTGWIVPNGGVEESLPDSEIDAKKWSSALDVEPMPDGFRRRRGTSKVNSVPLKFVSVEHHSGVDSRTFTDGSSEYIAQGVTVGGSNISVATVSVRLRISAGAPTGNLEAAIYTDTAGAPNAALAGAGFADFPVQAASGLTTSFKWYRFTLATPVTLTAATVYHLVLRHSAAVAGNTVAAEEATAGNPYSGGRANTSTDGTSWTAQTNTDLNFRVYAGAPSVTGLLDYRLSDSSTARILVVADREVYKEVSGTMTPVSDNDRIGMTPSVDEPRNPVVAQDRSFFTDGVLQGRKFYVLNSVEYWENDGIAPPTATPTLAAVAGGTWPNGTYYVDYWYWNNDLGIKSNTRYQGIATLSVALAAGNNIIRITNLPTTVAREGDRATHIRISIKTPSGAIFLWAGTTNGQVTLGTTTIDIGSDTLSTEPDYDDDVAPIHSCAAAGANQRFIAGDPSFPWRVYGSKITGQSPYVESFPALRYRDFGRGEGDYVTGLAFMPPSTLIVGMKNSIWAIDARRFTNADPVLIAKGVGMASRKAYQVLGATLFFVSDSDTLKGMMLWDQEAVKPLTSLDKTFKGLAQNRLKYVSCSQLSPGDNRFQWWTLCSGPGATTHNRILVYDWGLDAWTVYRISGAVLGQIGTPGSLSAVRVGGYNGHVYLTDTGTTDDGVTIEGQVQLKNFDFEDADGVKRARWIRYRTRDLADGSVNALFETDDEYPSFSTSLPVETGGGSVLGAGVLGSFILASTSGRASRRQMLTGRFRATRPKVSATIAFHFTGLSFGVQPTGSK